MKKIKIIVLFISMISLFGCGCAAGGGDPIEYDEDEVLEDAIQYLSDTYPNERFEYDMMGYTGGTDYVAVVFYALDSPHQTQFQVEWRENKPITDDYMEMKERDKEDAEAVQNEE